MKSPWSSLLPVNETIYYNHEVYLFTTDIPTTPVPNPGLSKDLKSRESPLLTPPLLCLPYCLLFHLVSVSRGVTCSE